MKISLKKVLSLVLCLSLCFSLAMPAAAVNENNSLGVTFEAVLDKAELTVSDTDQTVTMTVKASEEVTIDALSMKITSGDALTLASITGGSTVGSFTAGDYNLTTGEVTWTGSDAENITGVTDLVVATFTVPANTPAGTYKLGAEEIVLSSDYGTTWEDSASVSATLTITDASTPTSEYTANISTTATNNTVVNGQDIEVKVNVGGTTGKFSSAEIVLDYDPTYLTYKSATTSSDDTQAPDYEVDAANSTLTIRDYGAAITAGEGVYTVTFTAAKGGETSVELTSAGFSTKDRAETLDLLAATGLNKLDVTINHKVTVNNADAGSVAPNGSFEYTIPNYDGTNNDYTITVTMGGTTQTAPTPDENGRFTISNVTDDLVITYTATAKVYTVTFTDSTGVEGGAVSNITGATLADGVYTVTHGTDITFDVPANVDPVGTTDGYKYVVTVTETDDTSKTITATSADNNNGLTYTIDGDFIEANITITVTKETVAADTVTVTVNGSDLTMQDSEGTTLTSPATVAEGSDITLVLNPETGYTYEVKLGETDITSEILDDNQYTIENIADSVTVTVTKTLDTDSLSVAEYVQLDSTVMWLVTINGNGTDQIDGKTYSYNGGNMYWSSKYQAYCYLVVAENLDEDTAKAAIGEALVAQTATAVAYTMDVNISNTMDVNDAQLVWNMYNTQYSDFTDSVTMEKFLRADVNTTVGVDSTDAAAIISAIKNA